MKTVVVIPTRDNCLTCLPKLLYDLKNDTFHDILIMDNNNKSDLQYGGLTKEKLINQVKSIGNLPDTWFLRESLRIVRTPGRSIYRMWQMGWSLANALYPDEAFNLAILNDDIRVPERFLHHLSQAIERRIDPYNRIWLSYPDTATSIGQVVTGTLQPTKGSYRHGGMTGWAFMVRGELQREHKLPELDLQYEWWCGDDDLAFTIEQQGGVQARVVGLRCDHENEATARLYPELAAAKERDLIRFENKWGKFPGGMS